MSLRRDGVWGGYGVGELILADRPFADRIGRCYVKKDSIKLPNGVLLEGVRDTHIMNYLAVGTLAVAVQHSGDYFNNYVPVNIADKGEEGVLMTPFVDLEFGAYAYGRRIGKLATSDVRKIAAGIAINYPEPIIAVIPPASVEVL